MHAETLGLSASFVQGKAIATKNDEVSHIVLDQKWDELPYNRHETLKLWIRQGVSRLEPATLLDPSKHEQPAQGIPFFWKLNEGPYHYIGHYRSVNFEEREAVVKNTQRQALLEFEFVKHDESVDAKMSLVPDKIRTQPSRSRTSRH